jgi:hypothetical protein
LLAAQDLERAARPRRSMVTKLIDVGFWLVYGLLIYLLI